MIEIPYAIMFCCFAFAAGYITHKMMPQTLEEPQKEPEKPKEKNEPVELRNGFGVTREDNPTFLEQIVNVMNYNGTNQKEGDYGEKEA